MAQQAALIGHIVSYTGVARVVGAMDVQNVLKFLTQLNASAVSIDVARKSGGAILSHLSLHQ